LRVPSFRSLLYAFLSLPFFFALFPRLWLRFRSRLVPSPARFYLAAFPALLVALSLASRSHRLRVSILPHFLALLFSFYTLHLMKGDARNRCISQ
jgi:hypothetical protein